MVYRHSISMNLEICMHNVTPFSKENMIIGGYNFFLNKGGCQ